MRATVRPKGAIANAGAPTQGLSMRPGSASGNVMAAYVRAYEARNGKPLTETYLPLTYERGWVTFRARERPHAIEVRHQIGTLIEMTAQLAERAMGPKIA